MPPTEAMKLGEILQDKDYGLHMRFTKGNAASFYGPTNRHDEILAQRRDCLKQHPERYLAMRSEAASLLDETLQLAPDLKVPKGASPLQRGQALGEHWEADYLLMKPDEAGVFRLVGGCLCFPSHWALEDKLNQSMTAIHGPVPGLNESLGRQIDGFLARIKPGISWERANWGLARTDELNLHPSHQQPRLDDTVALEEVWWRLEDQSLVALPRSGGVLFGIKVSVAPLAEIKADPEARTGLLRALQTMPEAMASYKGLTTARERLIKLLS